MSTLLSIAGLAVVLATSTGCICARAPTHGRIPSRNLARAREAAPAAPAPTPVAQPQYVVTR